MCFKYGIIRRHQGIARGEGAGGGVASHGHVPVYDRSCWCSSHLFLSCVSMSFQVDRRRMCFRIIHRGIWSGHVVQACPRRARRRLWIESRTDWVWISEKDVDGDGGMRRGSCGGRPPVFSHLLTTGSKCLVVANRRNIHRDNSRTIELWQRVNGGVT